MFVGHYIQLKKSKLHKKPFLSKKETKEATVNLVEYQGFSGQASQQQSSQTQATQEEPKPKKFSNNKLAIILTANIAVVVLGFNSVSSSKILVFLP